MLDAPWRVHRPGNYAGRGALCPERKLKGHPPVSSRCSTPGCPSVTGAALNSQLESTTTMSERLIDQAVDMYCHGLARIDALGPNRRLIFTVPTTDTPGFENVVVKLILPAELLTTLAYMAVGADRGTVSPALIALEPTTAN